MRTSANEHHAVRKTKRSRRSSVAKQLAIVEAKPAIFARNARRHPLIRVTERANVAGNGVGGNDAG
jgi:hypothetical protein